MQQIELLINTAKNLRDKIIIESAYYPALRRFEIAKMRVEDINLTTGRLTVTGKFNKIAPIPVGTVYPQYINDLKYYMQYIKKKEGYLFGNNAPLEVSRINQIFTATAKLCRLKHPNPKPKKNYKGEMVARNVNPHLLRHSQARHLKDLGFSIEFVKNYMRHDSIKTTMDEYGTLSIDDMERKALEKKGMIPDRTSISPL
ncbi:MAG: site-specific integrase [Candidatus Aenigmarchaeota archaeon]|nr:site-specific integrase [Candidatus Aenigmarchaeota archaeon]